MAKTVVGLMDSNDEAQSVVRDLVDTGFRREDISLAVRDEDRTARRAEGEETGGAGKGAAVGAGTGAVLGGAAGLVVSLTSLAIPGIGPIIAAGPLVAALTGAGIGAVAGGVIGALVNMGVPEEHANYYAEGVRRGGVLVTVSTDDASADRAAEIMRRHGAVDIDKRAAQWKSTGWTRFDEKAEPYTSSQIAREREQVIPVVKEQVQVGKQEVEKGGVRVYSHVVQTPVEEKVTLREERARVERRPVDRPLSASETDAFKETSYEVRESVEEPVISKQARVTEEVVIGKEATQRTETVRDTVRQTEVEVEKAGARPGAARTAFLDDEHDFRSHFESHSRRGEDYETYRSAYEFGGVLPSDKRYEGKEWSAVEPEVHRSWEERHPGTWERFKDAIHYSWERKAGRARRSAPR